MFSVVGFISVISGILRFVFEFNTRQLQEKAVEATKQRKGRRKKHKPEEQEGMPQHHHCPHVKRREDRNPKHHEEQRKDVA
jgi:hypothetical protein